MPGISAEDSNAIVTVDHREYSLRTVPAFDDPLVQREAKAVMGQLSLKDVTQNLDLSVELFHVAYNGVAGAKGGALQADIAGLQSRLAMLCNDCVITMTSFEAETRNIIDLLQQSYRWLTKGQEPLAIKKLAHCKTCSSNMSEKAGVLADKFKGLQVESSRAKSNTILEEASERDRLLAAEKAEREVIAKQNAEQVNQQELVSQISNAQTLYEEAKTREEKEATKALVMGVVGAITGAIGAGLGAFTASQNPVGTVLNKAGNAIEKNDRITSAKAGTDEAKKQSDDAQRKFIEAQDQQSGKKLTNDKIKSELDALNEALVKMEQDGKAKDDDIAALKKKRDTKKEDLAKAAAELDKMAAKVDALEKDANAATKAYAAAGAALKDLAAATNQMASKAANAEDSIHEEKMKFLNQKIELENQKRASLVAMAGYAESLKNLKIEEGNATLSVDSLHSAIDALGKIIGTLTNASLFWDQMSNYCGRMTNEGFQRDIEDLKELDAKDRLAEYQAPEFMKTFLIYMCQWVALNGLSGDYLKSAGAAQAKAVKYLQDSPTIEEAIRRAPELAKNLSIIVEQDLSESRRATIELEQQRALIEQARAA
ncbi:hypothetical protein [Ensifer sp. 1H6]|uniref:hypothetical protein n=1 Tax=Ensifer sp. 1H6 TaxID=1911585 RepID=UPI0009C797DD|nr:hypothetical protein [Ensifer sp. 1H6]OMQ31939.1 hypothetical protein BKP54_33560 [Ensifer sp. 1H6]